MTARLGAAEPRETLATAHTVLSQSGQVLRVGLHAAQPHLKDGSVYRQNRPTRLDEIKNFHAAVQAGAVGMGASSIACGGTFGSLIAWTPQELQSIPWLPGM